VVWWPASRLRKLLGREHRVVLVEREAEHLFQPSLLWLMLGWRTPDQIRRPIARLARRGIEIMRGTVEHIAGRRLRHGLFHAPSVGRRPRCHRHRFKLRDDPLCAVASCDR